MERDNYIDGIRNAWLGEQFGEVFFTALAARSTDQRLQSSWRTLAKLEHVTGDRMAELLRNYGEETAADAPIEVGDEVVAQYTEVAHLDAMARMREVVQAAILRFDQLLAVAPDEDVPAVQFLVRHEQALLTFAECELAGDPAHALDEVERLLAEAAS